MTKTGRASPKAGRGGIGDNHGFAEYDAITKALAVEQLDQEEMKKLRELRKTHRSNAEASRVDLSQMDDLYKRKDDPLSDIVQYLKGKMYYLGAVFIPIRKQFDLFVEASESPETQHAARHAGRMAGIKGLSANPPPNLTGEDQQLWLEGHGDGAKARNEASKERKQELADIIAQAMKNNDEGKVTDGTGKNGPGAPAVKDEAARDPAAVAVGDKAAKEFALDNPEVRVGDDAVPPQPDWTTFSQDHTKWNEAQMKAFARWYDLVPQGAKVTIDHGGVSKAFLNLRDRGSITADAPPAEPEAAPVDDVAHDGEGEAPEVTPGAAPADTIYMLSGDEPFPSGRQATFKNGKAFATSIPGKLPVYDSHPDGFEMSPAELEQQTTRRNIKERQAAETPDAADVKAGAEKLAEAGFVDTPRAKRQRRLPGEKTPA